MTDFQLEGHQPLLKVEHHTKNFPHIIANDSISFDVRKGEVHCLLGENGAGKTTLAECLYGFYKPDAGSIIFNGKVLNLSSPRDAIRAGIGMVHQHFVLAPPMTVIENIVVGTEMKSVMVDLRTAAKKIMMLCENYGVEIDPFEIISQLSVGQQQWVEILKALYVGVELLILDEPTAVLTPQESQKLFLILKKMTQDGLSIILITHKLHEVMSVSDRVTVLRKGKLVGTVNTNAVSREELARMMVGRDVSFRVKKETFNPGVPILEIDNVHALKENKTEALCGFNLRIRMGEIVGLAGVAGNGQKELFDVVVGVGHPKSGQVILNGEDITHLSPTAISAKGLASIPQDRIHEGLLMDFSIEENLIAGLQRKSPFRKGILLNQLAINQFADQAINDYDITASSPQQKAKTLSGGNLQKVILAREFSQKPKCVIASSPTRGLDVGAMEYVYQRLVALQKAGAGILLISEDLDEIFNISDTIAVIFRGKIMGVFNVDEVNKERIGLLMAGIQESN